MKLRSASLRDLVRVEQIYREAEAGFSEGQPPARLWALFSHTFSALLPLYQPDTLIYVAEDDGKVIGFIQAAAGHHQIGASLPARASALQVLNLGVASGADEQEVAPPLVEHLCEQAGRIGATRLFVRIPLDSPLIDIFRMQGFRQYATESVLFAESPVAQCVEPPEGLRPSKSRDDRLLYHLYRRVTPWGVAHLEAPTYRDWKALRSAGQQEVIDRVEIVGWLRAQKGSETRPHTLSFMALPEPGVAEQLADRAIVLTEGQPALSGLRHYDAHMIDALRGRGFSLLLTQALLVREIAVRAPVPDKSLVPSFG